MMNMTGSCLCGVVKYATSADFEMVGNCHCKTCRKITGSAFEAFAVISREAFTLLAGDDSLVEYKVSPKAKKHFCGICGTPVFNRHRLAPGKLIVHLGSLDEPERLTPTVNLYCESMLPWVADLQSRRNFAKGLSR